MLQNFCSHSLPLRAALGLMVVLLGGCSSKSKDAPAPGSPVAPKTAAPVTANASGSEGATAHGEEGPESSVTMPAGPPEEPAVNEPAPEPGAAIAEPSAPAAGPVATCASLGLSAVIAPDQRDACKEASLAPLMAKLSELHTKVAAFLEVPVSELIARPVQLKLQANNYGPLASYYDGESIVIGAFEQSIEKDVAGALDPSVYVHELGHHLTLRYNPKLPSIVFDLASDVLFTEGFADWIALSVTGRLFADATENPVCAAKIRRITKYQSYNYPSIYFEKSYGNLKLASCCRKQISTGQLKDGDRLWEVCQGLQHEKPEALDFKTRFDPEKLALEPWRFDSHQLGIPFNSLLRRIEQGTGEKGGKLFLEALRQASGDARQRYTCSRPAMTNLLPERQFNVGSIRSVLERLKEKAATLDWAELTRKHGLDVLVKASGQSSLRFAGVQAKEAFARDLDELLKKDPALPQKNLCWVALGDEGKPFLDESNRDCAIKCF